jgi:hypothetical protein
MSAISTKGKQVSRKLLSSFYLQGYIHMYPCLEKFMLAASNIYISWINSKLNFYRIFEAVVTIL